MAILTKAICMFSCIPIKVPMTFITDFKESILNFTWKHKTSQISKAVLSKKNNAGDITISGFKLQYRAIVIKKQHGSGTKTDMNTNGTE
jgi:hypothetical protein